MKAITSECRDFLLAQTRTAKLATVRADGRPHVIPVWFDLDGDTLIFTTGENSVKARNIQRDARVSLCVDDETPPFSYVQIEGTAVLTADLTRSNSGQRASAGAIWARSGLRNMERAMGCQANCWCE